MTSKTIKLIVIMLAATLSASAQKLLIKGFDVANMDATASVFEKKDANGKICAVVKVKSAATELEFKSPFIVDAQRTGANEWVIWMPTRIRDFEVQSPGYEPVKVVVGDYPCGENGLQEKVTYLLNIKPVSEEELLPMFKPTGFYLGAGYVLGTFSGVGIQIGGSYKKWDLELSYRFGLSKSDVVNWYTATEGDNTLESRTEYKQNAFGVKAGYHLDVHRTLTVVPQLGMTVHTLTATDVEGTGALGDGAACTSLSVGAKAVYSPIKRLAVFVQPEYNIAVSKSDTYQGIADAADFTAGGFYLSAGLMFHF